MKRFFLFVFAALAVGQATTALATPHVSALRIFSDKYPNNALEGLGPVRTAAEAPISWRDLPGFNRLLPYVLPSPNQEEAGSCLYMSLTGAAEWWLANLYPWRSRLPDGPIDLSERFLMNVAGIEEAENGEAHWQTDSILLFNRTRYAFLNSSYPFTKGWYVEKDGKFEEARENQADANYGTYFNWINHLERHPGIPVSLPKFTRDVIFADPDANQWNIGVTPTNIVRQVKEALTRKKAPINVIYNHYGYWHAVNIVGFDDDYSWTEPCPFVEGSRKHFPRKAEELYRKITSERDNDERKRLMRLWQKTKDHGKKLEKAFAERAGCSRRGAFYVRDSLYSDPNAPAYDYDPQKTGEESNYAYPVIYREYEWLEYLANHVTQILVER